MTPILFIFFYSVLGIFTVYFTFYLYKADDPDELFTGFIFLLWPIILFLDLLWIIGQVFVWIWNRKP